MKAPLAAAFLLALGAAASAQTPGTADEVRKLLAAGVGDDVILAFLASRGPVDRLSADDMVALKAAGASDRLLAGLLAASAPAGPEPDGATEAVSTTPISLPASWYSYGPRTSYIATVVPPGAVYYADPRPCRPRYVPPCPEPVYRPACATRVYRPQLRCDPPRYGGYRRSGGICRR